MSKHILEIFQKDFGPNYGLVVDVFEQYQDSPWSVPDHWKQYFEYFLGDGPHDESIRKSLTPEIENLLQKSDSVEEQTTESEVVEEAPQKAFEESETLEEEQITSLNINIQGRYRKGDANITLGVDLVPGPEQIIVVHSDSPEESGYTRFYNEILIGLKINPIDLVRSPRPPVKIGSYYIHEHENPILIAVSSVKYKPIDEFFDIKHVQELRKRYKNFQLTSIFDTSLYYLLTRNSEDSVLNPFRIYEDIYGFESSSISMTLPYPRSDEHRLVKDLSGGWKEMGTTERSKSEPTPAPPETDNSPYDKIDFHLDDPSSEDRLSRKPIAEDLARIINNDIFGKEKCYSFMAHLQGRWGEGKSSFMKFLEEGLQKHGDNKWIVIHYNAWENQHVDPPWWTFLDALYKQSKEQIKGKRPFYSRWFFVLSELINRFNKPSLHLIIFFIVLAFIVLIGAQFESQLSSTFSFLQPIIGQPDITILALLGGGSLITIIQSWSKFLLMRNAENARLFVAKTENPAEAIRSHFDNLINSIQKRSGSKENPFRIAFFIDDLDRCDSRYIIKLLEGIQTMFNRQKVFYLVAADKHWIAKSFEHEYAKYSDTVKKGTKLGYSFIEKNFQLSVRLPNPSPTQISKYWDYILNAKDQEEKKDSEENIEAFKAAFNQTSQAEILSGDADLNSMLEEHQISFEAAQSIVLEKVNETTEDIEHLLREYHNLIGSNPRAVKRLANQYTIYRNIVLLEQGKVDPKKLFRWIVLQNRWPILVDQIELKPEDITKITKPYLQNINLENHLDAIKFVIGTGKENLTKEDVIIYSGISNLASNTTNNG
ncbi:MAG: P-loop NTPase fold protein [Balneola sp.]